MILLNVDNNIYDKKKVIEEYQNKHIYYVELKSIYYINDKNLLVIKCNGKKNIDFTDNYLNIVKTKELIDLYKVQQWSDLYNKKCDHIYFKFKFKNLYRTADKIQYTKKENNNIYNLYDINDHLNKKIKTDNHEFYIRSCIHSISIQSLNDNFYYLFFDIAVNVFLKNHKLNEKYEYVHHTYMIEQPDYMYLMWYLTSLVESFNFSEI
jgi:hypothetical protein